MLDWLFDLLSGKTLVKFGFDCWNSLSGVAMTLLGSTPAQVADGTLWNVSMNLVTVMKIVGASLFNLLFFVNFCKNSANLRDNQTLETIVTMFIRVILGNVLLLNFNTIINGLAEIMQAVFFIVAPDGTGSIALQGDSVDDWFWDYDADSMMLSLILSMVFLLVALAVGLLLILHVYGLFIKVFFYIVVGQLAIATVPGAEGAAKAAESWFKTFLCALGEFAGTALVLRFCSAMINGSGFIIPVPDNLLVYESLWNIGQCMLVMFLAILSVKTVDSMIRRSFGF